MPDAPTSGSRRFLWPVLLAACSLISGKGSEVDLPRQIEFFESKIRPVLIERCYSCHSSQSKPLAAGLRLDATRNERGMTIPNLEDRSEQLRWIGALKRHNEDENYFGGRRISESQMEDFASWIRMGTPIPRSDVPSSAPDLSKQHTSRSTNHWAFRIPTSPSLPKIKETTWPQTPVDFFILSQLEAKQLSHSPPADKATLIRRATFDLLGLPPSPQEVDSFLADSSPTSFAKVVDRLLDSPHYGERWGRYWLDVARYADTKGYVYGDREETRFVHSYVYRNWVVRAFNEDLPYDQFLLQQIAADQLTPAANESLAALGFLTLGRRFLGVIHDIIDDRIDVLMRGTQALTVGCARCHDHKFDPISTKDYYALYGVFAACTERLVPLSSKARLRAGDIAFERGLKERLAKYDQTLSQKREEFSNRFRERAADYLSAVLDVKKLPTEEHYEIRGPNDVNPTVVRSWETYLRQTANADHPVFGVWHCLELLATEDFATKAPGVLEKFDSPVAHTSAANSSTAEVRTTAAPRVNSLVLQALRQKPIQSMRDVAQRYGKLLSEAHHHWQESLRAAATNGASPPEGLLDPNWEELRQVLYGSNSPVNIPVVAAVDLEWYFDEPTRVQLMKLNAEIERWIIKSPGAPPYSVVFEDRPSPKNARVFIRGNPANKGEAVPRRFLQVLSRDTQHVFQNGSGRLELAQAIASTNNPLTARVMVNRIWLHHFGAGLVRTPSDFGTRSEPPSHPKLLDWLACKFMSDGWSIKNLHRLIMLSSTYQQSSIVTSEKEKKVFANGHDDSRHALADAAVIDPENRLLWRMNRSRLDFETLHDSLFSVTGELNSIAGGTAVDLFKSVF